MLAGVLVVAVPALISGGNALAAGTDSWGTAIEVPGIAALGTSDGSTLESLSCPSSGNCAAGGLYTGAAGRQAWVADETGGKWGQAIEVPGTAALNTGDEAEVNSVSCSSTGNCAAGGSYFDSSGHDQAFVADETGGVWGNAIEVPGTAALNAGGQALVISVSCAPGAVAACALAGRYAVAPGSPRSQPFVADETGGVWGNAIEVPGTGSLNHNGPSEPIVVSCPGPGDCTTGGWYTDSSGNAQPFVARETSGTWRRAIELPGIAALNTGSFAGITGLSCTSAGNCSASGVYTVTGTERQPFVASEKNGTWAPAIEMPGMAALNTGLFVDVVSLSCTSSGNCLTGGFYIARGRDTAFVISQNGGVWQQAVKLRLSTSLHGASFVNSLSCRSAGNCVAGGTAGGVAFVADEFAGVWRNSLQVPGTTGSGIGGGAVNVVSCARAGKCAVGGDFAPIARIGQAFVDSGR